MPKCIVKTCGKLTSHFALPLDEARRAVWIQRCGNYSILDSDFDPYNMKVCALHFEKVCFGSSEKRLHRSAVPSLFLPNYIPTGGHEDTCFVKAVEKNPPSEILKRLRVKRAKNPSQDIEYSMKALADSQTSQDRQLFGEDVAASSGESSTHTQHCLFMAVKEEDDEVTRILKDWQSPKREEEEDEEESENNPLPFQRVYVPCFPNQVDSSNGIKSENVPIIINSICLPSIARIPYVIQFDPPPVISIKQEQEDDIKEVNTFEKSTIKSEPE